MSFPSKKPLFKTFNFKKQNKKQMIESIVTSLEPFKQCHYLQSLHFGRRDGKSNLTKFNIFRAHNSSPLKLGNCLSIEVKTSSLFFL